MAMMGSWGYNRMLLLVLLRTLKLFKHDRHLPPQIMHYKSMKTHNHGNMLHQLWMPHEHPRQSDGLVAFVVS